MGFEHSRMLPGIFMNLRRGVYVVAHVDDLLVLGNIKELNSF